MVDTSELKVGIGTTSEGEVRIDLVKETDIIIAGCSDDRLVDMILNILADVISQRSEEEVGIHIYGCDRYRYSHSFTDWHYKNFKIEFNQVETLENDLDKIFDHLENHVKEIERRVNELNKTGVSYEEYREQLQGEEKLKWKDQVVVIENSDRFLDALPNRDDVKERYYKSEKVLCNEGRKVGFKVIRSLTRLLHLKEKGRVSEETMFIVYRAVERDLKRFNLVNETITKITELDKAIVKGRIGHLVVNVPDFNMRVRRGEGIFQDWDFEASYTRYYEGVKMGEKLLARFRGEDVSWEDIPEFILGDWK